MELRDKLLKLTAGRNKSDIAREAGIHPAVFGNYINRGSEPGGRVALRLASVLKVPVDWLLDDDADWPPPPIGIAALSDGELCEELGRRMLKRLGPTLLPKLRRAEQTDWLEVGKKLVKLDPQKPIPSSFADALLPFDLSSQMFELRNYDPHATIGPDEPPEVRNAVEDDECSMLDIRDRFDRVRDDRAYLTVVGIVLSAWSKQVVREPHQPTSHGAAMLIEHASRLDRIAAERTSQDEVIAATLANASPEEVATAESAMADKNAIETEARQAKRANQKPRG